MNRATFYTHYQDKYELLDLILDEMFAAIVAKWTPADLNIDDGILVRHFLRVVCEWQVETEKRINSRMTLSSAIAENARKQLHTITARCLKQAPHSLPEDQRRLEIIASMAGWSIYGIVLEWRQQRDRETVDQLIEHATPFVLSIVQSLKQTEKNTGWLELTGPGTPTSTTAARG
jgi:AcrR family transcriptional regulator